MKALLKNTSCGPETAIDGPVPHNEYTRCPNIFDALGLMNLSTMDPLVLTRALLTVEAKDVSKLSIINKSGRASFPNYSLLCPGRHILAPASYLDLRLLCYLGDLSLYVVYGVRS